VSSDVRDYENCCLLTYDTAQPLEVYEMNNTFQLGVVETSFLWVYEALLWDYSLTNIKKALRFWKSLSSFSHCRSPISLQHEIL